MSDGKKTVLRSIRLSKDHDKVLELEADKKGMSVNSLVTSIIAKYVEWDRFAESFGFVSTTRQGFRSIFDQFSDEALVVHGKLMGSKNAPDITRYWFGALNLNTFFMFLDLFSKYSGLFHFERKSTGRTHAITFHHDLGPRYSVVLVNYVDQAVRNIVGVIPKFETGNNSFNATFDEPLP
jgi:hypothetical protein